MNTLESVVETEAQIIFWCFEIEADHLISTRRPDPMIINQPPPKKKKENLPYSGLCPFNRQGKFFKKSKNKDKYLDLERELRKQWNIRVMGILVIFDALKGTKSAGNLRSNRDHANYSIADIGQNTEKSPGDLRTCSKSDSLKKPLAKAAVKNS